MTNLKFNEQTFPVHQAEELDNIFNWSEEKALKLAEKENIELKEEHWKVIKYIQEYCRKNKEAPKIREVTSAMQKQLTPEDGVKKGHITYLYKLFPQGYAQVCKIAGVPALNCRVSVENNN